MPLDVSQLTLGTMIALLKRQLPGIGVENQILEGIKMGKKILLTSEIAELGGDSLTISDLRTIINIDITSQEVDLDVNIVGSTIMAPVDIQGAYIMMPVDIQGQFVDLDINIKAQEVTIDMDIEAQSVGIYLQPEWAVKAGTQKYFQIQASDVAAGAGFSVQHPVPSGKTFYLTHFVGLLFASSALDADKPQIVEGYFYGAGQKLRVGGNGGFAVTFPTPPPTPAGATCTFRLENRSGHTCDASILGAGYEI